ncbi:MAG: DedA family protein, partial [Candidatus Aenigmarchaeota archaeon]|nr:DedA family protein [Candidatus Aenigmarchaeota archaeon]
MLGLLSLILHADQYINTLIQQYGIWVYLIVFLIILIETGLVVVPFLPGDSLLFVLGAFAAAGSLNIVVIIISLSIAAIAGDTINYWMGHHLGRKVFSEKIRFLKKEHLDRTEKFYEKHGGKTIIIARFMPVIRTFAPFVAGVGKMNYKEFLSFNAIGGIAWVVIFALGGFVFGNIPVVKDNLGVVIIGIIVASFAAVGIGIIKHKTTNITGEHEEDKRGQDEGGNKNGSQNARRKRKGKTQVRRQA